MPIWVLARPGTLDRIPAISTVLRRELHSKGPSEGVVAGEELRAIQRPKRKVGQGNHAAHRCGAYAKNGELCVLIMDSCNDMHKIRERLSLPEVDVILSWMLSCTVDALQGDLKSKRGQLRVLASCNNRDSQSALDNDKYDFLQVQKYTRRHRRQILFCKVEYSCGECPTI